MDVQMVVTIASGTVAIGAAIKYIPQLVKFLRRSGHFLDQWLGDEDTKRPGIVERLDTLEQTANHMSTQIDSHVSCDVPEMLEQGQQWGNRLETGIAELNTRVDKIEERGSRIETQLDLDNRDGTS
jgi:hypothetical protein